MTMHDIALFAIMPVMTIALLMSFLRFLRGPSLPDRVVALDFMSTVGIGIAAIFAIATDEWAFLDVATVIALTAFLGTIAFAYYIEQRRTPVDGMGTDDS
jgi:multicomponent Na+:H+ antiporter subunit F